MTHLLSLIVAVALTVAGCTAPPQTNPDWIVAEPAALDAATTMNKEFRDRYAETRDKMRADLDVILFVSSGRMMLRQKGEPDWIRSFSPPVVDQYKVIAHVPLGTYVMALPYADKPASDELRAKAAAYREKARALADQLDHLAIPPAQRPRQRLMLDPSLAMLDKLASDGTVGRAELEAFARRMGPPQLENADISAAILLDTLHATTQEMRAKLKPGQWERLYVLVMGGKMPRAGNLQFEYFVRVLGRGEIERRLIYTEGLTNPDLAFPLMGTILIDRTIGHGFFNDRYRMDRDLLSDGARKHLDQMFGRPGR
jgi:hypothetical protein